MADKIKIILDTDIGDDIDDAIALCYVLGSPEFELLGVTTVYGDAVTRARIARKMLAAAGRADVPVLVGAARPMGWNYHPGTAPEVCSQRLAVADDRQDMPLSPSAVEFIIQAVRAQPGQVHIVTIGSMTNIGMALCIEPKLASQVAGVTSLAGYRPPRLAQPEWNVRYDPLAAESTARSGAPWTAVGADCQGDSRLTQAEFLELDRAAQPLAKLLLELVALMSRYKGKGRPEVKSFRDVGSAHVADVIALASLLVPERLDLRPGRLAVDAVGAMSFEPDPAGPHRLAMGRVEADYRQEILRRILAAGSRG